MHPSGAVSEILQQAILAPEIQSLERDAALRELTDPLRDRPDLVEADWLLATCLAREELESTALPQGVAFPHARGPQVRRLFLVVGRSPRGLSWTGDPPCRTRLVFLIGTPVTGIPDYLALLRHLSGLARREEKREMLLRTPDPDRLREALLDLPT